jgi:hypothetical protein
MDTTQSIKCLACNQATGIRSPAGVKYLCLLDHIDAGCVVQQSSHAEGIGVLSPRIMRLARG